MRNRLCLITLLLCILCPAMAFTQVDLKKGMAAYYPFNGNANDESGNGNNPVFNNATLTNDYFGNESRAYHFNGVDNYMEIPNSSSLNSGNKMSICAWVKPTGFYYGKCHGNNVIMKGNDDFQNGNYMLRFDDALYTGTNCNGGIPDTIHQTYYGIGTGLSPVQDTPYAQKDIWRSVVYTYDGLHAKLYIDCNLVLDSEMPGLSFSNNANLFFGKLNNSQFPYWLDGDLDEVRIYDRALNDDEVKAYSPTCTQSVDVVVADFTGPDTACMNTPVQFQNTSVNATNYYWSFCSAGFSTTPVADNLGNPGNLLKTPVFMDYALDDNGNYYGFISNYENGHVVKLNYGSSLLNYPTAVDLGNFDGLIPIYGEGIQVKKANGKCYVFVVAAGDNAGSGSVLVRLDFGSSFSNTPTAMSLGNMGGLLFPHDLFIAAENNNFYGFTINISNNTITRFDFGNNLENQPVGINLGSFGDLDYPCGFSFVKTSGTWYALITNRNDNSISRLDFGTSLTNMPTGTNIGNPGNFLNRPRDISIFQSCNGIIGLVVNEEDETTGAITKLDFGIDVLSNPQASELDNLGSLKFPHSISQFFLEENDIYSFVTNVKNNTVTRLRYTGCTCTNISSSTSKIPPAINYSEAGVYNINLLVDIGLPTQTSFCKQIVVKDCSSLCDTLKIDAGNDVSICYGDSIQLNATGANIYKWNSSARLSDTTIANPFAYPSNKTLFVVKGYDTTGCFATDTVQVTIWSQPVFTLTNDTVICVGGSVQLQAMSSGNNSYNWLPSTGLSNFNVYNPVANPTYTTQYYVTVTDVNGCKSFDSVNVNVLNLPKVSAINDTSICEGKTISLNTNISDADIIKWFPKTGLDYTNTPNPNASPSTSTLYTITANNGICSEQDSVLITVLSLPALTVSDDTTLCGNGSVQLNASGATVYTWSPVAGLSNPDISNPVASPALATTYFVTGTDNNSCAKTDSVVIIKQHDPVFNIAPQSTSICSGDSALLTASGGDIYNWLPIQTVAKPSAAATAVIPTTSTTYEVIVTNSICKVTDTLYADVTVKELPLIAVSKSNDIDCINYQAQLAASGGINYQWYPSVYINNTQINNPVVNPPADTWYSVMIKGTNSCFNRDSILVKSTYNPDAVKFEVAGAFTPNHDGINDCFSVKYWGPADFFDMSIYNRWGQLVFHSNNISACWDGTLKGQPQATGTYVYQISVSSNCSGGLLRKKGTIVLLR